MCCDNLHQWTVKLIERSWGWSEFEDNFKDSNLFISIFNGTRLSYLCYHNLLLKCFAFSSMISPLLISAVDIKGGADFIKINMKDAEGKAETWISIVLQDDMPRKWESLNQWILVHKYQINLVGYATSEAPKQKI